MAESMTPKPVPKSPIVRSWPSAWDCYIIDYKDLESSLHKRPDASAKEVEQIVENEVDKATNFLNSKVLCISDEVFKGKKQLNNIRVWWESKFPDVDKMLQDLYKQVRALGTEQMELKAFIELNVKHFSKFMESYKDHMQNLDNLEQLKHNLGVSDQIDKFSRLSHDIETLKLTIQDLSGSIRVLHCQMKDNERKHYVRTQESSDVEDYDEDMAKEIFSGDDLADEELYSYGNEPVYLDTTSKLLFNKRNDIVETSSVSSTLEEFLASQLFIRKNVHLRLANTLEAYLKEEEHKYRKFLTVAKHGNMSPGSQTKNGETGAKSLLVRNRGKPAGSKEKRKAVTISVPEAIGSKVSKDIMRRDYKTSRGYNANHMILFLFCVISYSVTLQSIQPLSLVYPNVARVSLPYVVFCMAVTQLSAWLCMWTFGRYVTKCVTMNLRYSLVVATLCMSIGCITYQMSFAVQLHVDSNGLYLVHGSNESILNYFSLLLSFSFLGVGNVFMNVFPACLCTDPDILLTRSYGIVAATVVIGDLLGEVVGIATLTMFASSVIEINIKVFSTREVFLNEVSIPLLALGVLWFFAALGWLLNNRRNVDRKKDDYNRGLSAKVIEIMSNIQFTSMRETENVSYYQDGHSRQQLRWASLVILQAILRFVYHTGLLLLPLILQAKMLLTYVETIISCLAFISMALFSLAVCAICHASEFQGIRCIQFGLLFSTISVFVTAKRIVDGDIGPIALVILACSVAFFVRFTEYSLTTYLCNVVGWPSYTMLTYGALSPLLILHTSRQMGSLFAACAVIITLVG